VQVSTRACFECHMCKLSFWILSCCRNERVSSVWLPNCFGYVTLHYHSTQCRNEITNLKNTTKGTGCAACTNQANRTSGASCGECNPGYVLEDFECLPYGCVSEHENDCRSCADQDYRTSHATCATCFSGHYLVVDTCRAWECHSTLDGEGCASCVDQSLRINNETCDDCNNGYVLQDTVCFPYSCDKGNGTECFDCVEQELRVSHSTCASCNALHCLHGPLPEYGGHCLKEYHYVFEDNTTHAVGDRMDFTVLIAPCADWNLTIQLCSMVANGTFVDSNVTKYDEVCTTCVDPFHSFVNAYDSTLLGDDFDEYEHTFAPPENSFVILNVTKDFEESSQYDRYVISLGFGFVPPDSGFGTYYIRLNSEDTSSQIMTLVPLPQPAQASSSSSAIWSFNDFDFVSLGAGAAVGVVLLVIVTKLYGAMFSISTKKPDDLSTLTQNSLSTRKGKQNRRPSHTLEMLEMSDDGVGDEMDTAGL
jgi:hypothetical protein